MQKCTITLNFEFNLFSIKKLDNDRESHAYFLSITFEKVIEIIKLHEHPHQTVFVFVEL